MKAPKIVRLMLIVLILVFTAGIVKAETYTIDASQNCIFLSQADNIIPKKSVKIKLEMNTRYRVTCSGEGFYSTQTGKDADPMPGVVLFYSTNEEDGFASKYLVLKSGQSIEFTTPNEEPENVFMIAFVMDFWAASPNRGAFTLKVENIK
jgi:hypothetical protein